MLIRKKTVSFTQRRNIVPYNPAETAITIDVGHKWVPERVRRRKPLLLDLYPTPYERYSRTFAPVLGRYYNSSQLFNRQGCLAYWGGTTSVVTPLLQVAPSGAVIPKTEYTCRAIAEASLLKQLRNSKLNAAMLLAEGKETLAFVGSSAGVIAKAVEAVRLGKGRKFAKLVNPRLLPTKRLSKSQQKRFSSLSPEKRWLEFNFALLPLIEDVQGSAQAVADIWVPKLELHFAYASAKHEEGLDFTGLSGIIESGYQIRQTGVAKHRYSTCLWYRVNSSELKRLTELGFTNPANLLYNTTRLSFVVDWLIPVGKFLEGWDSAIGVTCVSAYQVSYLSTWVDWHLARTRTFDRVSAIEDSAGYETYRGFVRRTTLVVPYPTLWIRNPLSSWTVVTAAALIKQSAPT